MPGYKVGSPPTHRREQNAQTIGIIIALLLSSGAFVFSFVWGPTDRSAINRLNSELATSTDAALFTRDGTIDPVPITVKTVAGTNGFDTPSYRNVTFVPACQAELPEWIVFENNQDFTVGEGRYSIFINIPVAQFTVEVDTGEWSSNPPDPENDICGGPTRKFCESRLQWRINWGDPNEDNGFNLAGQFVQQKQDALYGTLSDAGFVHLVDQAHHFVLHFNETTTFRLQVISGVEFSPSPGEVEWQNRGECRKLGDDDPLSPPCMLYEEINCAPSLPEIGSLFTNAAMTIFKLNDFE